MYFYFYKKLDGFFIWFKKYVTAVNPALFEQCKPCPGIGYPKFLNSRTSLHNS